MTKYDKYIFGFLFALCILMIFSCKNNESETLQPASVANETSYTSEGTISSGTKDTMNDHTSGIQSDPALETEGEVPVKGETVSNANKK